MVDSLQPVQVNKAEGQPYHTLMRGTEAVAVAAPVTVTLLNLFSLFILFYKTLRHTGTGFAYGFINASYLHQGLAVILSCYVLHADREFLNELESHSKPLMCQHWTGIICHAGSTGLAAEHTALFDALLCAAWP